MIWTTEKLNTFFAMKDQGYTLKEIAAELGCTVPAVQSKSHKISTSKKESTKMENSEKKAETVETPTDHIREVVKMVEPERPAEVSKTITRADILDRAKAIVTGEREKQYGKPEDNFAIIAELWGAYTGYKFSPVDVAMMMALLKVARLMTGDYLADNYVDICGYVACAGEIAGKGATTSAQATGDAENEETDKYSDEINDAQRAE